MGSQVDLDELAERARCAAINATEALKTVPEVSDAHRAMFAAARVIYEMRDTQSELRRVLEEIVKVHTWMTEDPVDQGWGPLDDQVQRARALLELGDAE